jgi:hypothetical protein
VQRFPDGRRGDGGPQGNGEEQKSTHATTRAIARQNGGSDASILPGWFRGGDIRNRELSLDYRRPRQPAFTAVVSRIRRLCCFDTPAFKTDIQLRGNHSAAGLERTRVFLGSASRL